MYYDKYCTDYWVYNSESDEYVLKCNLPGYNKKTTTVKAANQILIIATTDGEYEFKINMIDDLIVEDCTMRDGVLKVVGIIDISNDIEIKIN